MLLIAIPLTRKNTHSATSARPTCLTQLKLKQLAQIWPLADIVHCKHQFTIYSKDRLNAPTALNTAKITHPL